MRIIRLITHLFFPHESNNQKAKFLHSSSLGLLAVFLVTFQLVLNFIPKAFPRVLGYAANISPTEVIRLTNEKRAQNGLSALTTNSTLSQAAVAKGNDMLAKGYWAHFAPDGTSPWSFFLSFGYKYRYAGENLARDFSNPQTAVEAWMNSPTHRDNILNPNYRDIGIGVVEGSLSGVDTTIIVQFFGSQMNAAPSIPVAKAKELSATVAPIAKVTKTPAPETTPTPVASATPSPTVVPGTPPPQASSSGIASFISPFTSTKNLSLIIVTVLLAVLAVDLIAVRRKRIVRIGGKTLAHLAFFGMILAVILILKAGRII